MELCKVLVLILGVFLLTTQTIHCQEDATETEEKTDESPIADEEPDEEPQVKEENGVLVLTTDNFDDVINQEKIVLVEFYAPWCGHCKSLAPKFEAAAQQLKKADPPVILAKVDATVEESLGSRFEVQGYPTLKWFKDGDVHDYDGPRDEEGIIKYMKEHADPNWAPPPEAVVTLTKDNFDELTQKEDLMLVEFYTPWCGHCKKLAPEYEQAAKELKENSPPIVLAKVNADEETDLKTRYNIEGFPTLKLFRKGKDSEYKGGRDKHGIIDYMKNQVGDGSKKMDNLKALKATLNRGDEEITIVGFFSEESPFYTKYMEYANDQRTEYNLVHTFDAASRDTFKVNPNSVVIFPSKRFQTIYEPKYHILTEKEAESISIEDFIKKNQLPLAGEYGFGKTKARYDARRAETPLVLFFYSVDWSFDHRKATKTWQEKIANIATQYQDLTFAVVDEQNELFTQFGFDESGEDMNVGIMDTKGRRYPMEPMEEFDADEIKSFITSFKKGNLKPKLKSQKVGKQTGPLYTLSANNFDQYVNDKSKDVLVEFYAPWCGHCKQLDPVYAKLAKKLKGEKNLIIAKMDATANDVPSEYDVTGFPTIYYVPSNKKDAPVKYEGGRDIKGFTSYLKEHATVTFGKSKLKDEL